MTWSDGNDYCSDQYGTSLATITNDEDAQLLFNLTGSGVDGWISNRLNGSLELNYDSANGSGFHGSYFGEWELLPCDNTTTDCSPLAHWNRGQPMYYLTGVGTTDNSNCLVLGWSGYYNWTWWTTAEGYSNCTEHDLFIHQVVCDLTAFNATDSMYPCTSHDECPESTFCYDGECDLCDECHYCHDGIDGTCGSCGDGYPLYDSNCVTTDTVTINGMPCSLSDAVYVSDSECISGSPHYDSEGDVCANDGQWNEAYCSYELGDSACAYCSPNDTDWKFEVGMSSTDVESWPCSSHDECPESTFCYD